MDVLGSSNIGRGTNNKLIRLGIFIVALFIIAWATRTVSPNIDGCEGGCVAVKQPQPIKARRPGSKNHANIESQSQSGNVIDPFSEETDLSVFETDDDDDDIVLEQIVVEPVSKRIEDDNEDTPAGGDLNKQKGTTLTENPGEILTKKSDEEDEDQDGDGKSKFLPIQEGTLGYAMMRYKDTLEKLETTKMIVAEGDTLEARGIKVDEGVHIITTFFHGTYHDRRFKELMATLVSNIENPEVTAMHVLWQGADPRYFIPDEIAEKLVVNNLHRKLVLTEVKKQPTYKVMFQYANDNLKRGAVAIVTNADIYFDSSLKCVSLPPKNMTTMYYSPEKVKTRVAFALSRRHSELCKGKPDHHSIFDLCEEYTLSHDAFVFAPPIPKSIIARTDHTQNQGYGAENIVIFEFKREKFKVLNPCFTLKGYHLHCVNERHYVATFVNRVPPRPGASWPQKRKCGMWVY